MQLVRLIYVSVMKMEYDKEEIKKILKVARSKNARNNITGLLCYDPKFFLQYIEGPRDAINKLYASINRDERHTDVTLLEYAEIEERLFGNWSMGFTPSAELDKSILDEYAGDDGKVDPFSFSGKQALSFLVEVVALKTLPHDE